MQNNKKLEIISVIGLVLVTVIWGGGFVAADIALVSFSPLQIMVMRFFIASILFGLLAFKSLRNINKKEMIWGASLGVALFIGFIFQTIGLKYTTPSKNAFITALNVVIVPFIAYFVLKKKLTKMKLFCAILSVVGVGILSVTSNFTIDLGDFLTLICAFGFALQIFLTSEAVKASRVSVLNFIQMLTAFLYSFIGLIFSGEIKINFTNTGLMSIFYLGLVSTGICYMLQTFCQKHVDESKAAVILSMEAVFGTIFSMIILGEILTFRMIIGSLVILAAVVLANIFEN